jgi:riboflavin biosynthesis pyrimidine reductase
MLDDVYLAAPRVRANLVQGGAGEFVDETGSSRGISNAVDLERLLQLRELCDVVVTDGETARRELYRVPRNCDLAVITRSGYSPRLSESKRNYLEIRESPAEAIRSLVKLGYKRILLEVGPNLLKALVEENLVDQICMTNTGGSTADLSDLGVRFSRQSLLEIVGDTTFTVWDEIQT